MWPRREAPDELLAAVEDLRGIAQILVEIDARLERIVALSGEKDE